MPFCVQEGRARASDIGGEGGGGIEDLDDTKSKKKSSIRQVSIFPTLTWYKGTLFLRKFFN
jgi:hypothetical protein